MMRHSTYLQFKLKAIYPRMEIEIEEQSADCFLAGAYVSLVDMHAATLVLPNGQGRGCEHACQTSFLGAGCGQRIAPAHPYTRVRPPGAILSVV